MDDAAREAAVAAALEHIRRSTAYSAVLRGYGSYEQYEDVAERLSEIRVSASMLPAAGAAAQRRAAMRPALRGVPVPPQYPPLTVVYLRLIGEFLDKIVRHPDYISLAADEVQPSTEGYNDIPNALWHVKRVLEKIVVADDTPVLVAVSARYGQVAREFGRMEARLLTDEDTDLPAPTVEFVHWQRQQGRGAAPAPPGGGGPGGVKGVAKSPSALKGSRARAAEKCSQTCRCPTTRAPRTTGSTASTCTSTRRCATSRSARKASAARSTCS